LTAFAETWTRLAAQLEADEGLLNALSALEEEAAVDALPLALDLRSWPMQLKERSESAHRNAHSSNEFPVSSVARQLPH
jgi:hypothetical protein